jgi:transcriptional regulator with XRE-family HTH domain
MAAKLDMADSYLSEIENGKSKVGPEFFLKISNEYNVRIEFIFHGEGDMFYSLKRKIDSEEFDFKDNIDSIEKIVWLMENSPLVKNTILGFTTKFILDNEETVRKSIEIYKTKKKDLNPIS